jgi:hypothetical protein
VEAISDSLRRELLLYGIDVIVIRPWAVKTPIWEKGAIPVFSGRYDKTDYSGPLNTFQDFAEILVSGGDSPDKIGRFFASCLRPKGRKPGTLSSPADSRTGSSPPPCLIVGRTVSSIGAWALHRSPNDVTGDKGGPGYERN